MNFGDIHLEPVPSNRRLVKRRGHYGGMSGEGGGGWGGWGEEEWSEGEWNGNWRCQGRLGWWGGGT